MPAILPKNLCRILAAVAVGLHLLPLWVSEVNPPRSPAFVPPPVATTAPAGAAPDFREELIDPALITPSVHDSSICELSGGRLGATWYGGTCEGHEDVAVYFSIHSAGQWSPPQPVVTAESASRELHRFVKKVGNAVVFADARGTVWLVYVTVAVGGWSGSSLNLKRSFDDGRTWTPSRRLTLSPLFNISELVKDKPSALTDGGWALPYYNSACGKFPELLWLHETSRGVSFAKTRMFGGQIATQPSVVPLSANDAVALCRPAKGLRTVMISRTSDAGRHWSAPTTTGLLNPDSGLDALRLSDGRLLIAYNDTRNRRENLRLAISCDNGSTWTRQATMAEEAGAEFSYPSMIQSTDGLVHLVYTWRRKGIKHVAFNLAWLNSQVVEKKSSRKQRDEN